MRKQKSSTTSGKGVYNNLGIDGGQRSSTKKKKELTRKEVRHLNDSRPSYKVHNLSHLIKIGPLSPSLQLRKQDRDAKKSGRQPRQNLQVSVFNRMLTDDTCDSINIRH